MRGVIHHFPKVWPTLSTKREPLFPQNVAHSFPKSPPTLSLKHVTHSFPKVPPALSPKRDPLFASPKRSPLLPLVVSVLAEAQWQSARLPPACSPLFPQAVANALAAQQQAAPQLACGLLFPQVAARAQKRGVMPPLSRTLERLPFMTFQLLLPLHLLVFWCSLPGGA